ncbi:MAG: hypothetical protein JWO33_2851 [Caulobacteraceae bacterium]|nr:hypothetical protein [Caulobacteraceae bacterium]
MSDPKIEHRIGIQAPPLVVWDLLADIESWPSWNPIYTQARGRLGYGEALHLTCALPDKQPVEMVATVTEWVPEEQILWTTEPNRWLLRTTRYLEIDKLTETACIFANGELLQGWGAKSAARQYGRAMYNGFELMGEAVKARAEAMWIERQAATR